MYCMPIYGKQGLIFEPKPLHFVQLHGPSRNYKCRKILKVRILGPRPLGILHICNLLYIFFTYLKSAEHLSVEIFYLRGFFYC